MKKLVLPLTLLLVIAAQSFAQRTISVTKNISLVKASESLTNLLEEQTLREKMKNDGLTEPVMDRIIAERKKFVASGRTVSWTSYNKSGNPAVNASCADMGVDNGWGTWAGAPGATNGTTGIPTLNPAVSPPVSNAQTCFTITSGAGIDPCTPGVTAGDPPIPLVSPGFGSASIQLGCPQIPNCGAEQLTYAFTPTVQDTNFVYSYAIVLYDPGSSHGVLERPYAQFMILDQNGDTIPCSFQKYVAPGGGGPIPGFYAANAACSGGNQVTYKPWTTVGINLGAYIGQTLTAVITNVDCSQCGHYAHSYWDFLCGSIPLNNGCNGTQSTICATPGEQFNPYSYQWYKNGNILAGSTSQCIAVPQNTGDVYLAHVMPASGCDFYMSYVATPGAVQSLFTYSVNVNAVSFMDLSTGATQWNWNFGDGNFSTNQNPSHTYVSPGTYTACLVVNDGACWDTVCKTITISVVGVYEDDLASSLSVFPSPASKSIFLDFNGKNFGEAEVSISNIIGDNITVITVSGSGKHSLNVSEYAEGIYFLRINTPAGTVTKKIVISR